MYSWPPKGEMLPGIEPMSGYVPPGARTLGRTDWSGYDFTAAMIAAAQRVGLTGNVPKDMNADWWHALRASGYVAAAIAAGGGEVPL